MTTFNSSIDIDDDTLVEIVTEHYDFESKVESVVDKYDISDKISDAISDYDFDYDIQNVLDRFNLVDADEAITEENLARNVIYQIQQNEDLQYEIRMASGSQAPEAVVPESLLRTIHALHSVCGKIAQQMAIINAMTGVAPWPNEVATELQSIASTLMSFGIDVTKTNEQ